MANSNHYWMACKMCKIISVVFCGDSRENGVLSMVKPKATWKKNRTASTKIWLENTVATVGICKCGMKGENLDYVRFDHWKLFTCGKKMCLKFLLMGSGVNCACLPITSNYSINRAVHELSILISHKHSQPGRSPAHMYSHCRYIIPKINLSRAVLIVINSKILCLWMPSSSHRDMSNMWIVWIRAKILSTQCINQKYCMILISICIFCSVHIEVICWEHGERKNDWHTLITFQTHSLYFEMKHFPMVIAAMKVMFLLSFRL